MTIELDKAPRLSYKFDLPGGQSRLKEAILYVSHKCERAPHFGLTKLNKILWVADFTSFAERAQPVTGRTYQKLDHGPAPIEILPVLTEMQKRGEIFLESIRILSFDERRPKALVIPSLRDFSPSDLGYLDRAIARLWEMTGAEVSDLSHGVAWKTREIGDLIPYQLAYLVDGSLSPSMLARLTRMGSAQKWTSD